MIKYITICLIAGSVLMSEMVKGQELSWDDEKISLYKNNAKHTLMNAESIFEERWDELAQAQFWQKINLQICKTILIFDVSNVKRKYDCFVWRQDHTKNLGRRMVERFFNRHSGYCQKEIKNAQ
jgi:hypothetical protein